MFNFVKVTHLRSIVAGIYVAESSLPISHLIIHLKILCSHTLTDGANGIRDISGFLDSLLVHLYLLWTSEFYAYQEFQTILC